MKPALLALPMALAACASRASVEARAPIGVLHPGGEAWALDPDVLQREAVAHLRAMGYADGRGGLLYQGVRVGGLSSAPTEARVAEALPRPLEG